MQHYNAKFSAIIRLFFNRLKKIVPIFLFASILPGHAFHISDYQRTFIPGYDKQGNLLLAIRAFYHDNELNYLMVDPYSFETQIKAAKKVYLRTKKTSPGYIEFSIIKNSPYYRSLIRYTSSNQLQNQGIKHAQSSVSGMFLTIDMCPSSKRFEKNFFDILSNQAEKNRKPLPIAISISGAWIIKHKDELKQLNKEIKQQKLNVLWINHSYSHLYFPDLPLDENFLLLPFTNIDFEILETERLLIESGQLPSVFFRYPGLVSNADLMQKLRLYGLIPIGSDAWLAKGEQPNNGSIILVHGNSNEHKGIVLITDLLRQSMPKLLPLTEAFKNTTPAQTLP